MLANFIDDSLQAHLHSRFLSQQFDAIFVAHKLQLQNRTSKPGAIFSAICRCDIAGVSNMFGTCCNLSATKIASSCRNKNRLCKQALLKVFTLHSLYFWHILLNSSPGKLTKMERYNSVISQLYYSTNHFVREGSLQGGM